MAKLEHPDIKEPQLAGSKRAKAEGKALGRENTEIVAQWCQENSASIKATAERLDISTASVKPACWTAKELLT